MDMLAEPGAILVVLDPMCLGVLVEVVDQEEVARPLGWPYGEQSGLARNGPFASGP
ncbi:hypothetical protein [Streptomyces rapamycinicus]|uniref:Uncharacterized protein n=1 Tax=Streptomyces rapamycinicus TaxID=1226757 RepID=A0ABR6LWZ6_9ACTN|nr:hypothetical protein [Streptomyces rapamycinicus]MBB4786853.1 hypothetical protein [Streptomyces rapamycinicus]UTO66891.1 hypothetical protein LJB45_34240 [Streptomyces rapamycinicus]UTP34846.1 hypothetical protein LIV37_39370 [Streptomyces rapamycinicus NRRL 5491]